jgi:uncharacterized protein (UPF0371 family)
MVKKANRRTIKVQSTLSLTEISIAASHMKYANHSTKTAHQLNGLRVHFMHFVQRIDENIMLAWRYHVLHLLAAN